MSRHLPSAVTYTTIGMLAIAVNVIEIILILRNRRMIRTFEYFLLNLAAADCICGVILSIQNVLYAVTGGMENDVLGAFTAFSLTSSITNLLAISLHRLLVVKFPLQHHLWITKRRKLGVVALIWIISLLSTCIVVLLSTFKAKKSSSFLPNLKFVLCVNILISSFMFILVYGYIINLTFKQNRPSEKRKQIKNRRDKVLQACVVAVSAFIICSSPYAINYLVTRSKETYTAYLLFANILVDPGVYFFKSYLERNSVERQEPRSSETTQNSTL